MMTFTVLSVHDARLLGWGLGWCPVGLGYGYLRPWSEEEYVRLLSSAAWSTAGAEGLQRYTPISTSSSLCEVETESLHAYPGFSPALVAIFRSFGRLVAQRPWPKLSTIYSDGL